MSHFDSCQLILFWLTHTTLNYWQTTDSPARVKVKFHSVFIFLLVSVTYYISLYVGENDWSFI